MPSQTPFNKQCVLMSLYTIIFLYGIYVLVRSKTQKVDFIQNNYDCVMDKTMGMEYDELWSKLPIIVNQCSTKDFLNMAGFTNTDETKYHIMPLPEAFTNSDSDCTILSLGVGKDVVAEKLMQEAMPNCQFYGADPVNDTNADIYPEVGKFFNIAVGGSNGTMRATVLEDHYKFKEVRYVDIATFMREFVKRKVVDQVMIDIEHAEYPMLPMMLKDGQLAKEDVVFCQINIEIHNPSDLQKQMFFTYYKQMMAEKEHTMLVTSTIIGHIRLFMINHAHPECRRRYITEEEEEE